MEQTDIESDYEKEEEEETVEKEEEIEEEEEKEEKYDSMNILLDLSISKGKEEESKRVLTPSQVETLINLRFPDDTFVFDIPEILWEWIPVLLTEGYEKTLNYLQTILKEEDPSFEKPFESKDEKEEKEEKDVEERTLLLKEKLIFDTSPFIQKAREQLEIQNELLRNKPIRVKNGYPCPSCGSKRTMFNEKQVSRIDESSHKIIQCLECNKINRVG